MKRLERVVVVLGYSDSSGNLTKIGADRIALLKELLKTTETDLIILSGCGSGAVSEAAQMREMLNSSDCPILLEEKATITAENAAFVKAILEEYFVKEVLVITSSWHQFRAWIYFGKLFKKEGAQIKIIGSSDTFDFRLRMSEIRWLTHIPKNAQQAKKKLASYKKDLLFLDN